MIPFYERLIEIASLQGTTTCAVMTNVPAAQRTIEVGCGPGRHSIMLASNFVQPGGVLVSTDISNEMVKRVAHHY
jgi:ubiquinone/menaquinone biosynthesis C-methylase UbiE